MKKRSMVFDTGVLVEILKGTADGVAAARLVEEEDATVYVSELNVVELRYVVCRQTSDEGRAEEVVSRLLSSGYFRSVPLSVVGDRLWRLKCAHPISLGDAATLALARTLGLSAVFRRERELEPLARSLPELVFLDELVRR